ncbi:hypothetical protein D3C78_1788300 [compost metagenome]
MPIARIQLSTQAIRSRSGDSQRLKRSLLRLPSRHQRQLSQAASQISIATANSSHLNKALLALAGMSMATPARMPGKK